MYSVGRREDSLHALFDRYKPEKQRRTEHHPLESPWRKADCLPLTSMSARYKSKQAVLVDALEHRSLDFEGVQSRVLKALRPLTART